MARVLADHEGQVLSVAFAPDGRRVVGAGAGGDVCLWSVPDGALVATLADAPGRVGYLAFSPDGARLAAGLVNGDLELWEAISGTVLLRLPHAAGVFFTRWSPSGDALFALPMDDTVRVLR